MSVLIKGRQKPESCLMCQFHGFGGYKNELIVCSLTGRSEGQLSNVPDCPLVEVPTPHGRLVDCEALKDDMAVLLERNEKLIDEWLAYAVEDVIDEVPTIIEAEEGAEE